MSSCELEDKNKNEGKENVKWLVRPMRHEDIDKCLTIWSQVELTEARQTVTSVLAADPGGFYVAELEDSGEVIGMCAGPMTRPDTAFMGFYAVAPKYQGIGIGRELWSKTSGRLDSKINLGLYGVPSMSEKYKKSGFAIEDTIRMLIFESERYKEHLLQLESLKNIEDLMGCRLVVIDGNTNEAMFKKLVDYDQSVQKFNREKLLRLYLTGADIPLTVAIIKDHSRPRQLGVISDQLPVQQQHQTVVPPAAYVVGERKMSCCAKPSEVSIIEDETLSTTIKSQLSISASNLGDLNLRNSPDPMEAVSTTTTSSTSTNQHQSMADSTVDSYEILGYGCIRDDNNSGGMVGPIYADSSDICEVLLGSLMDRYSLKSGNIYSIMALSSNKHASKILTKVGLKEVEQCSRMFTKFVPAASFSKIYFVHSPNFTLF